MSATVFEDSRLILQAVTVRGVVNRPITWNSFPGSVIHGTLGFQLKEMVCVREDKRCDRCFLVQQCPYSLFLETRPPEDTDRMKKFPRVPSPLRISVHPWDRQRLESGEEVAITLIFIGRATESATPVLLALTKACADGLGRKWRDGFRGTIDVQEMQDPVSGDRVLWDTVWYERGLPFEPVRWSELTEWNGSWSSLRFVSPARIQARGRVQSKPSYRDLMSSLTRRVSNLAYFHASVELDADFRGLLQQAEDLPPARHVERARIERYSGRQQSRFRQNGTLPEYPATSIPDDLRPWLALGRFLGVGKGTTMGFGEYVLR